MKQIRRRGSSPALANNTAAGTRRDSASRASEGMSGVARLRYIVSLVVGVVGGYAVAKLWSETP